MNAPERLWADWDFSIYDGVVGVHQGRKYVAEPAIEYLRADLVEARIGAAVQAERERCAVAASEAILNHLTWGVSAIDLGEVIADEIMKGTDK